MRHRTSSIDTVSHEAHPTFDFYEGTRDALIAAGVCKPEWFPTSPKLNRRGYAKRRFKIETGEGTVSLVDRNYRGQWAAYIPVSEEERGRRAAREQRRLSEGAKHLAEVNRERLAEIISQLPPFDTELTERGQSFMRVLLALDERHQDLVVGFAEDLLLQRPPKPRRAHLTLVVDNERTP